MSRELRRCGPAICALVAALLAACGGASPPLDRDSDGDGIEDSRDNAPADPWRCADKDQDGCDDCAMGNAADVGADGWDPDGDGLCELPVDAGCMQGAGAAEDPWRVESCAMLALLNRDRAHFTEESGGGAPLVWSEAIWQVAAAHNRDMCQRSFFAHVNPDGADPSTRATLAGLGHGLAENLALDLDLRSAVFHLMSEPTCRGHRGNILKARAIDVGIGYLVCDNPTNPYDGYLHVTQDFRWDFAQPEAAYCGDWATDCELPPDPPSTAVCPARVLQLGFCAPPDASLLTTWQCPVD